MLYGVLPHGISFISTAHFHSTTVMMMFITEGPHGLEDNKVEELREAKAKAWRRVPTIVSMLISGTSTTPAPEAAERAATDNEGSQ